MLVDAPDMQDVLDMKAEIVTLLADVDSRIAALTPAVPTPAANSISKPEDAPSSEKWSKDNHPAYRKQSSSTVPPAEEKKATVSYQVNDTVLAKYAGDKQYYEARVISVTGSSAAPIYTVNFKGYTGTETLRQEHLRPLPTAASSSTAHKRKADGSPAVSSSMTPTVNTHTPGVISAAANINPALADAAKKDMIKSLDTDKKPPKKVKTSKALESSKSNWKSWQSKASTGKAAKTVQKESMFRTGDAPSARGMYPNMPYKHPVLTLFASRLHWLGSDDA
jgi:survival-of-motor-neuron-related-splicing factor 30